ncbi:esterase B1-like [Anopheles bellator]|uniref:esterase B1-like n=1 Tax=Anopheles bellator TaxID=139047 RepID=UPI002649A60D|nr:esterase B1-like [Anopheles bellator]
MATLIVSTANGPVQGTNKTSLYGVGYASFQGIPYAKPPVGALRFTDPVPPENWTDVLDCTKQCDPCYHFDRRVNKIVGSEDSLRLNIFTKTIKPSKPLPVMVYLYGGGFVEGTSGTELYGPDYLIEKDIVLVTLNYRVGALGFLCCQSRDAGVPGNAGLKDQRLALKWVSENIVPFGGDPANVTLFGHSAGGASVQYHTISEASKNLFQRAIIMSGSTMCDWSVTPQRSWPEKLAKALGWQGDGEDDALQFLRQASPEDIVAHQENIHGPQEVQEGLLGAFAPTIEPYESETTFIPKSPLEMSRSAWSNAINVMIGGTSEEGLILLQKVKPKLAAVLENPNLFVGNVPHQLSVSVEQRVAFGAQLKQLYYPNSVPSPDNLGGFIDMATDRIFWHGLHRSILSRANLASAKTFVYRVAVDSTFFNHYRIHMVDSNIRGTSHADELSYLFSNVFATALDKETMEYRVIREMVDIFTSFATTGDPNCPSTAKVSWKAVPKTIPYECFNISNEGVTVEELPELKRLNVWDSFYANDSLF